MTPIWASPSAAPPSRTSPIFGWLDGAGVEGETGACCANAEMPMRANADHNRLLQGCKFTVSHFSQLPVQAEFSERPMARGLLIEGLSAGETKQLQEFAVASGETPKERLRRSSRRRCAERGAVYVLRSVNRRHSSCKRPPYHEIRRWKSASRPLLRLSAV